MCGGEEDEYGNIVRTESKVTLQFEGINSSIIIGKNVELPNSTIKIGSGIHVIIKDNCKLSSATIKLTDGSSFIVAEKVSIVGMNIFINTDSLVEIGKHTTMQTGKLRTGRNQMIKIGEDCMFSWDIVFLPHDGHLIWDVDNGECTNNTLGVRRESVVIGNHVWVGGETVFLPNTRVGTGTICGYRSLVKGIIPNNCIVAGSPAKVIRKNVAWSRENISLNENDYYKIQEEYRRLTEE